MATSIPKNSYQMFIENDQSPWWDNSKTAEKETRDQIIKQAAINTLQLLNTTSGENSSDWHWGKIHMLTHKHPLDAVKPLRSLFNVGPFVVDGGSEVLNNLQFSLDSTGYFPVTIGPALRKITDFSDMENGITVSPTGQSGNVMSAHYSDQAEMFATGKFRKMLLNRKEIETKSSTLLLKPE
jgi:penicillin G amidase